MRRARRFEAMSGLRLAQPRAKDLHRKDALATAGCSNTEFGKAPIQNIAPMAR